MKNKSFFKVSMLIALFAAFALVLAACDNNGGNETTDPAETLAPGETAPTDGDGGTTTGGAWPIEHRATNYRAVQGGLPDPAAFTAHQHSSAGTASFGDFAYEGLIRFQRGTDDIAMQLAEGYSHDGLTTYFYIRENAMFNDGVPFGARDVWAFYAINWGAAPSGWLTDVRIVDDHTVAFDFRNDLDGDMRLMLIAQEVHHGRIPYHIYGDLAYRFMDIRERAPMLTEEELAAGRRRPFGTNLTPDTDADLYQERRDLWYDEFVSRPPNDEFILIGTGPYINVPGHSVSEGRMIRNPYHWNPDQQTWDEIIIRPTTDATRIAMMQQEEIHWFDGTLPMDMTLTLLESHDDLVYFPMHDPAAHGLIFNLEYENAPMDNVYFRRALVYAANRAALRDIGSYQSELHPFSLAGMPVTMVEKYVIPEVVAQMREYEFNLELAEENMILAGATRGSDNNWLDADGNPITLTAVIDTNWLMATQVVPIYAIQLQSFGIPTQVFALEGATWWERAEAGDFALSWDWVDVAWNFSYPFFPLSHMFNSGLSRRGQFPVDDDGIPQIRLTDYNGEEMDVWSMIQEIPLLSREEAEVYWSRIVWAVNDYALGINFYQNVTGSWENLALVDGLPMLDRLGNTGTFHDRWMPFAPDGTQEQIDVHEMNIGFSGRTRNHALLHRPGGFVE